MQVGYQSHAQASFGQSVVLLVQQQLTQYLKYEYILSMNLIRTITRFAVNRLIITPLNTFAGDQWKDRDEAAEKVYISKKERQTLKKLLDQVESEELDKSNNAQRFESKLSEIMQRYKIENESLKAEIAHLHRDLRE